MARMLVVLAAAFAAVAVWPTLGLLIALAAIGLFVVAWRRPMALTGVMAHPLVQRVPAAARATPLRFASTVAVSTIVLVGAASVIATPGQAAGDDDAVAVATATPRAGDSASPRPTSSPRPTAEPTARPTAESTPLPTATPEPTPAFGSGPTGPTEVATVASVTDGDTIRVMLDGQNLPVRYIGIDTPETQNSVEWMGHEASEANARLVAGQTVVLERDVSETDRYGRLLRYVWLDTDSGWLLVNLELLRLGVAEVTTYPPDVKYVDALYLPAQREARESGIGLWGAPPATPAPVAPAAPGGNCELSYPDFCLPIGTSDLDCGDVQWRRFTVLWDVANPDPHRFDREGDGLGCES